LTEPCRPVPGPFSGPLAALCLAAALGALAGCATKPPDIEVTGSVLSRERLYVPPEAVFDAALVDVSRPEDPPVVLARQRIDPAGLLPYPLRLSFYQSQLHPQGRYEVRAAVRRNGAILLDTPGVHPVLFDPAFRHVDVVLAPVRLHRANVAASVPLRQSYWKLVSIEGEPPLAAPAEGQPAPHLVLQRDGDRAIGGDGCNRFVARFAEEGGQLRFQVLDASVRLCLQGAGAGQAFLRALGRVTSYMQEGRDLVLRDIELEPLLRFRAQEWGERRIDEDEPPMLPQ